MYFPEVFHSFVCFVALCVGGVGGPWIDETALCGGHKQRLFSDQQILGVQSRLANNDLCGIIFTLLCKKVSLGISLNLQ